MRKRPAQEAYEAITPPDMRHLVESYGVPSIRGPAFGLEWQDNDRAVPTSPTSAPERLHVNLLEEPASRNTHRLGNAHCRQ